MGLIRWSMLLGLSLALAACGPRQPQPMTAFEGRLTDWAREILVDSPESAAQAGVSADIAGAYQSRLDDRSVLALVARRSAALRRYTELRAFDPQGLSADDQFTLAVLRVHFEDAAAATAFEYGDFSPLGGLKPYVLNQLDSAFVTLPSLLDERHPIAAPADAENYLERLGAVATALDSETARAREDAQMRGVRPPQFIIDATLAQLEGVLNQPAMAQPYITGFQRKLDALAVAEANPTKRAVLVQRHLGYLARAEIIVRDAILPAHRRAWDYLRAERAHASQNAGVAQLPQGGEFYAATLRIGTTTNLSPSQIHQIGQDRVAALTGQLDVALRRVGLTASTAGQRLSQMTTDPRYRYADTDEGRAGLLHDVRARVTRVRERASQWFGRLPRAGLEVRRVPAFAEDAQPGAYYSPPSLDGTQAGIYYVNLRNLAEMTRIDVPTQDFHEAIPGHHFQTSLAQEQANVPLLRRLISFNAYSEGWALYAEELADEVGLLEGDPVGRIGFLRWQLWRAARLVVDTGLHARGWSRQQAIDYMVQTTGDAPGVIATEVDRYVVWPGQACGYELGRREFIRLREVARNELGPDFDLRGFHDAVLTHGEVPLSVLESLVRAWIPQQRALAERERQRR